MIVRQNGRIRAILKRVPRLVRVAFRMVLRAAPREFAFLTVVQLFTGIGVALQLLVGRKVLADGRVERGGHGQRRAKPDDRG